MVYERVRGTQSDLQRLDHELPLRMSERTEIARLGLGQSGNRALEARSRVVHKPDLAPWIVAVMSGRAQHSLYFSSAARCS